MADQQQQQGKPENPEFSLGGPFGGIQSELPPQQIERLGFRDSMNMIYREGTVAVRPAMNPVNNVTFERIMDLQGEIKDLDWANLQAPVNEPFVTFADFFNSRGNRLQCAFTPSRFLVYNGKSWSGVDVTLTTNPSMKFATAVVGQKLCFSQGVDKVQYWDGLTAAATTIADAKPAKYLMELGNHLVAAATLESGSIAYQRVRWTGAGDPTDWTSPNAGQTDLFNDLGPINNVLKLFQGGYVFQQNGIVQMSLTGVGTQPFYFQPLSAKSKGLTCPRTLAANGETYCAYVGRDNIYSFDGTTSTPIGDMPIGNRVRLGARTRIFGDLMMYDPMQSMGFVSSTINGYPFNAYWLVIPKVAIWIFNFDEGSWSRWDVSQMATCINGFSTVAPVRIIDLIGSIAQQLWAPISLTNNNPYDSVAIGFADGSIGIFDFTGRSERPWFIKTGQLVYGDPRHSKTTTRTRLVYVDRGSALVQFKMESGSGQVVVNTPIDTAGMALAGTSSGDVRTLMVNHKPLAGVYNTVTLSGEAGVPFELSELALTHTQGGEAR